MKSSTLPFPSDHRLKELFSMASCQLRERSRSLVVFLDTRMEGLIVAWIALILMLGLAKVAIAPVPVTSFAAGLVPLLPYLLIAFSPVAGYRVAAGSFPKGLLSAQPIVRLCRYGSWRQLDTLSARQNPAFGPVGFMASLLVGLLLNVPFRSLEFMLAVPAIAPGAPDWAHVLMWAMTADVVVMNFFYMICFVMAIRSVPLFPRMLLFAWIADVVMQLAIAQQFAALPGTPPEVASALQTLIEGNLQKVAISAFVWIPYLVLSERVNITFRQRVRN
ncbi:DUF2569 family protein [Parafrankia sp. BMG5.11]|uniref:DUF2569 family protein n=1 Tax=Parafrankia sp. BMG5.11 TaxID=222540 RepID=UPI00103E479D|nr:DUF2569 family protein [Parafrankia sp. BMG5.11]TCJ39500.1 DUF2569 family protein [Parafrankia sp. BMG5.11]